MKSYLIWLQGRKLIWLGIVLGVSFYLFDVAIDVLVFSEATFLKQLLRPEPAELWMRGSVLALAVAFGVYAHIMLKKAYAATERAARVERFLDSIVDNIPDMVFVKDADSLSFVRINHAGEALLGLAKEDLIGKSDFDFFPQIQAESFVEKDREVLRLGKVLDIPSEEIDTRQHGRRLLHTKKVPVLNDNGQPIYLLGISEDITDRKRAESELLRARARAERYLQISEAIIVGLDGDGNVDLINRRGCEILGYEKEDILGKNWFDIALPVSEKDAVQKVFSSVMSGQSKTAAHYENEIRTKTGEMRSIAWNNALRHTSSGEIVGTLSSGQDVTTRKKAEDQWKLAATVFESTNQAVTITDSATRIISVNPAFTAITGYRPIDVIGNYPSCLQSGHHDEAFYAAIWQTIDQFGHWKGEIWDRRQNGEAFPSWQTISVVKNDDGEVVNYVSVFSDITPIKQHQAELDFLAHHDPLTGLPNRLMLDDRLEHALERLSRTGSKIAVLFLDLDEFKSVNDSLGHAAGDRLLRVVAERLQKLLRAEDTVARMGGDEFVIVLESYESRVGLEQVLVRILKEISDPVSLDGSELVVTACVGVAIGPDDGSDRKNLLRAADLAMYRGKTDASGSYRFYSDL